MVGRSPRELSIEHIDDRSNLPAYKYLNRPTALPTADFGGFGPDDLRTVNQGFESAIPGASRNVGKDSEFFRSRQTGAALHLGYDFRTGEAVINFGLPQNQIQLV